jgi:fermentation-respiration switch protein FrsA (DUF1100 family)
VLGWILVGIAVVVGVPTAVYLGQDSMLFFPRPLTGPPPASRAGRPVESLQFQAPDGARLRGWLLKTITPRAPLVIYYGGNAEEVSAEANEPGWPSDWSLALVNYRGYGTSEGKPSEQNLFADALLVFDSLAKRSDVDRSRIVLVGRSLGTGVAVFVAAVRPVAEVILASPFDSMVEVGRRHYPWLPVSLLLKHRFDSQTRAPHIQAPLLAIVGGRDTIIPPAHSKRLFEAWGGPKTWVDIPSADHNDLSGYPRFWEAIASALGQISVRGS